MRNQFNEIMQKLRAQRVRARRYTAMLLVLAMLTSLSVSWRLHQVGTALTTDDEYCCGMEEHVHTDDCYTEELVCGYEEGQPEDPDSAFSVDSEPTTEEPEAEPEEPEPEETEPEVHHHTADCYETVLVEHKELTCGQEEHTHDETCPVDPDTGDFLCGFEEHTHTDDCFTTDTETEEKLICGYEEGQVLSDGTAADDDGIAALEDTNTATSVAEDDSSSEAVSEPVLHHHTEACYKKVLTCTIPEHTHTLECLADYSADVETDDDWQKYSVGLSDNWNEALLAVAKEQLGYKESEKNFQTDEALGDIIDVHHYTRYGAFYGNPYADWDVAFIAFCQHYAGIPKTEIPQRLGLEALRADMDAMGFAYLTEGEEAAYEAIPGDVVTYNKNGTADDETIGIVETVGDDSLTVISGAVEGAVAEVTVPFTDVTSTILVDQAYGDYVGEADDRDGSHDDEIAVQPADEKDAAAVYASDTFDKKNAVDLDTLRPTFKTEIPDPANPDKWISMPTDHVVTEGDSVRIEANFTTTDDTFKNTDDTCKDTIYCDLGVHLKEPLKDLPIEDHKGNTIGRFSVSEEGLAVLKFNHDENIPTGESSIDLTRAFDAYFSLTMKADLGGDGEEEKVQFPGMSGQVTIYRKRDVEVKKSAPLGAGVGYDEKGYFIEYKVEVSTQDGTGQEIYLHDVMTQAALTGKYDATSFAVTDANGDVVTLNSGDLTVHNDTSPKTFDLKLPKLDKGESYTLTYKYRVDDDFKWDRDYWYPMRNTIEARRGSEGKIESTSTADTSVQKQYLTKSGSWGNADVKANKISWTIEVKNPAGTDLGGYTIKDALDEAAKNAGVKITGNVVVQAGSGKTVVGGTLTELEGETGFTYAFPAGSKETYYKITYSTTVPNASLTVKNNVDFKKGDKTLDQATGSVDFNARQLAVYKSPGIGDLKVISKDGKKMEASQWKITVVSQQGSTNFTAIDVFQTPKVKKTTGVDWTVDGNWDQYAIKKDLEEALKKGMTIFTTVGNFGYNGTYKSTTMESLVTFHFYSEQVEVDAKGNVVGQHTEVEDEDGKVRSFTITLNWEKAPFIVTQINVDNYVSYIEPKNDTVTVDMSQKFRAENTLYSGGKDAWGAYEKTPKAGKLTKLVADNPYWFSQDSMNTTYSDGKNFYFKLFLENPAEDEITITDTLPKGMTYADEYYVGYSPVAGSGMGNDKKLVKFAENDDYKGNGKLVITTTEETDGRQTITFKLTGLNKWMLYGKNIGIVYKVKLSDAENWGDVRFTHKDYTNKAECGKLTPAQATVSVDREEFHLNKEVISNEANSSDVKYKVEINKGGKQLLSSVAQLKLDDTFTVPKGVKASLKDFTLYKVDQGTRTPTGDYTLTGPNATTKDDGSTEYVMNIWVHDEQEYSLEYTYSIDTSNAPASANEFTLRNKIDIFGHGKNAVETKYQAVAGGAGTKQEEGLDILTLLKVEQERENITLDDVTFDLYAFNPSTKQWDQKQTNLRTTNGGRITFATMANKGDVLVAYDTLYKVVETKTREGYALNETPHYFLLSSDKTTFEVAYQKATGSGAPVAGMTPADKQGVVYAQHNDYKTLKVTNATQKIQVAKVWRDENGEDMKKSDIPNQPITVKLWKYLKNGGTAANKEEVGTVELSDANNWRSEFSGLSDDYYYVITEENAPDGYHVIYTDAEDQQIDHEKLTTGSRVSIINQQKTNQLTVRKHWFDENNQEITKTTSMPDITLNLYSYDPTEGRPETPPEHPDQTCTMKAGSNPDWTYTFTGLDENKLYYVVETPVVGYVVDYVPGDGGVYPGGTIEIYNTKTATWLDVEKVWLSDEGTSDEERPKQIVVQLYKVNDEGKGEPVGGQTMTLTEEDNWKGRFEDLDPNGKYYVDELNPGSYTVTYGYNEEHPALPGATITVTNRKNAPGYELPATGSTGTAPYTAAGAVLMGAALVGGYRRKRRQERRGE